MLDIWFVMVFGVVGYLFKKLDYSMAPLVLALVLGDKADDSLRQAMVISQREMPSFWSSPLVGSISTLALVRLLWPVATEQIAKIEPAEPDQFVAEQTVD